MWIVSSCSPLLRRLPALPGLLPRVDVDRFGPTTDAGMCTSHEQCSYLTPVCDTVRSMCVACTPAEPGSGGFIGWAGAL